jgi:hypothetical protein
MLSVIIEVVLGLALIYTVLSVTVTVMAELLAQLTSARANTLRMGIARILSEKQPGELTKAFYAHPLIQSLARNREKPDYIPSHTFTLVLLDLIVNGQESKTYDSVGSIAALRHAITMSASENRLINDDLRRQLQVLLDLADDVDTARLIIEKWFNDAMARVSGWYKRRTQLRILLLSVLLVVLINADTLMIFNTLSANATNRSLIVAAVGNSATSVPPETMLEQLTAMNLETRSSDIFGWSCIWNCGIGDPRAMTNQRWPDGVTKVVGLLFTVFVVTLGAVFWFDLLKRIINIRASGKPERPLEATATPT